jgi:predicted porin
MNKQWLAAYGLGLASASAGATGQTNVTLYGIADIYTEVVTNQQTPSQGSGSLVRMGTGGKSGSRWGIKAVEELPDGWRVDVRLESSILMNNGKGVGTGGFDRSAWLALSRAGWGGVRFGRQYTSLFDVFDHYSVTNGYSTLYEPDGAIVGINFRENNMVKYYADFDRFSLRAHYSFGGTPGAFSAGAGSGFGFEYSSGLVGVAAGYDDVNGAVPNVTHFRRYAIAAMIHPGPATFIAGFEHGSANVTTPGVVTRFDFYWAGVRYRFTPALQALGGFYYENVVLQNPGLGQTAAAPTNPKQVTLEMDYSLSKSTLLYVAAGYAWRAALDFDNYNYNFLGYSLAGGKTSSAGVALGMRKQF